MKYVLLYNLFHSHESNPAQPVHLLWPQCEVTGAEEGMTFFPSSHSSRLSFAVKDRSSALPEIPSFGEQTKGGPAHPDPWVSHADSVTWPNFQKLQLEVIWAPFTSSIPSSVFLVASLKLLPVAEVMDVVLQPLGSAVQGSLVCSLHVNASWK